MYPHVLTAALAGQNVAVLDYVEPSLKGKKKKRATLFSLQNDAG